MFADALRFTHNGTGGSGTITLAATTGYPQPSDVFGTSGTRIVYYEIAEYTDSTFATLSKYERGLGSLVLSTGVLTRTPKVTWSSGGAWNGTTASALTFGNTAANFQITLGANAATQRPGIPTAASSQWTGAGYLPFNTRQTWDSSLATLATTNGRRFYCPIEFIGGIPITTIAMECTTNSASAAVRVGLYDWDTDGLPGNLIVEFTASAQLDFSASTGIKSVTGTATWVPPGWYYLCIQGNTTAALMRLITLHGNTGTDSAAAGRDFIYAYKDTTYGALPAGADKTYTAIISRSSGNPPWVGYK